jgi:hypothetical protein
VVSNAGARFNDHIAANNFAPARHYLRRPGFAGADDE